MLDFDIFFFGWCKNGRSDKVWIAFTVEDECYVAWGRRGKTLQFKHHGPMRTAFCNVSAAAGRKQTGQMKRDPATNERYHERYIKHDADKLPDWAFSDINMYIKKNLFNAKMANKVR